MSSTAEILPTLREPPRDCPYLATPLAFMDTFSAAECDAILAAHGRRLKYLSSVTVPREGIRSALTAWLPPGPELSMVMERLSYVARQVAGYYGFEIDGFRDHLLLCTYGPQDHFDWHYDIADLPTSTRKLSLSAQLSEPEEYEGGGLEFAAIGELPFSRQKGTVIVFPSYLCHRVAPVTKGRRSSLIGWIHGPAFR